MAIHPSATVHPSAAVDPSAEIAANVHIHAHVIIEANTSIGEGTVLMPGVVICQHTIIGKNNRIHYHAVIGGDPQYVGFDSKMKTGVIIGDRNELRESVTVNRSIYENENTIIGNDCMMMINSHAGHDCVLADGVIVANNALLAGHVQVGSKAFVSGNVAVHQFVRIGRNAMIGGMVGVPKDIPPFALTHSGGGNATLMGLNKIGLRRAGITQDVRVQLSTAFKRLFKESAQLPLAIKNFREEIKTWDSVPSEVEEFLTFCEEKSKRGITFTKKTPRVGSNIQLDQDETS